MDQLLALFPLSATVLFPGSALSLHIFEERYKLMISRCIALKEPFGVVLIREGDEVRERARASRPAEPYEVGTSATIIEAVRYADGQMDIVAEGQTRFRVTQVVQSEPYMIAAVEMLEEEASLEHEAQGEQLRQLYDRYRATIASAMGVEQPLADLPPDPIVMSYQLSSRLQVPLFSKQQLLEADLETRLDALAAALQDELSLLPPPSSTPLVPGNTWSLN
jgi:uncharacterized protein